MLAFALFILGMVFSTQLVVGAQGPIDLVLTPSLVTVDQGQIFSLNVEIQSETQEFNGANIFLDFDPAYLQVSTITLNPAFTLAQPNNGYDNEAGAIEFGAATPVRQQGTVSFITIVFTAVAPIPNTDVAFSTSGARETLVTRGLTALPVSVQDASITIQEVQPPNIQVLLTPGSTVIEEGQPFSLTVELQSGDQLFSAVEAALNFDPTYINVTQLTLAAGWLSPDGDLSDNFSNLAGTVDVIGGYPQGISGTVSFLTVDFIALQEVANTDVIFADGGGRTTRVALGLNPLPTDVQGASVTITASKATLNGSLSIDVRTDYTDVVTVKFYELGTSNLLLSTTANVDAAGNFTVADLTPGAYSIAVKTATTLQVMQDATLNSGANPVNFGQLLSGDANNDNIVDLVDFSLLSTGFFILPGEPGYDLTADFNNDGIVDLVDFSILSTNFGQSGDFPPQ
jgi:hypothetical protein